MAEWRLDEARAEDWLPTIADASVDLILTDPPYHRVKSEPWDRQWDTAEGFLAWLAGMRDQWQRILKPNGSLYCFASPEMAAQVEVCIGERFNVLNHIVWVKDEDRGKHAAASKEALREYFPNSERIIFVEQFSADCEVRRADGGFVFAPILGYMLGQFSASGLRRQVVDEALQTANVTQYWLQERGFIIPTAPNYRALQRLAPGYFRREYEDLRREYEDLRRPFSVTRDVPYTDVWRFSPVPHYPGKHPCEKPSALVRHIIATSSRPGGLVLDCFAGSGVTGIAARQLGRRFIGCEMSPVWAERARRRIADAALQLGLPLAEVAD